MSSQQKNDTSGNTAENIWNAVASGAALKDIHGVSDDVMEGVYALAYDFYNKGQLAEAEAFFRFLCLYDYRNPDYVTGLAAVFQLQRRYASAADLYTIAYAISDNDFRPVLHAGQCQLAMLRPAKARQYFEMVVAQSQDENLKRQAASHLAAIDNLHAPGPDTGEGGGEAR